MTEEGGGGEGRRRRRRRRPRRGGRGPGGPGHSGGPGGPGFAGGPSTTGGIAGDGGQNGSTPSTSGTDTGYDTPNGSWGSHDPGAPSATDGGAFASGSDASGGGASEDRTSGTSEDRTGGASEDQHSGGERSADGGEPRPGWGGGHRHGRGRNGRYPNRGRGRGRPQRGGNHRGRPRRGRTGENWWARRWVEVLERFAVGRRLGRGRNYARQGHIVDIEIGKGFVTAHVQGSRDAPYLVRMHFSMLSSTDWKKITRALVQRPDIAVELGMGQIPEAIESVFEEQHLSLFPAASGDLKAACSCPDNANPCKHVAAVYYLLGEEFDRDPFLIFQLRGMERGELLAALGPAAIPRMPAPPPPPEPVFDEHGEPLEGESGELAVLPPIPEVIEPPPERVIPDEPLPADPGVFWGGASRSRDEAIEVRIPRKPGAVVARLGGFPFWRGQSNCEAAMARIYRNASISGLDVYLGAGAVNEDDEMQADRRSARSEASPARSEASPARSEASPARSEAKPSEDRTDRPSEDRTDRPSEDRKR